MYVFLQIVKRTVQLVGVAFIVLGALQLKPFLQLILVAVEERVIQVASLSSRMAYSVGFIALGIALILAMRSLIASQRQFTRLKRKHPNEPWLWNAMWAEKHIRLSNRGLAIGFTWFALVYLFLLLPGAIASNIKPLLVVVIMLGVVGLVALRLMWMQRMWNRSELKLVTLPGVLGGPFTAVAIIRKSFPSDTVYEVSLKCRVAERVSKKTEFRIHWTSTNFISRTINSNEPNTTLVPVNFAVPIDCPPTDMDGQGSGSWSLSVGLKDEINQMVTFDVPVFKTADSRAGYQIDEGILAQYSSKFNAEDILKRYNLKVTMKEDGFERFELNEYNLEYLKGFLILIGITVPIIAALAYWTTTWPIFWACSAVPLVLLVLSILGIFYMFLWKSTFETLVSWESSTEDSKDGVVVQAVSGILGFRKKVIVPRSQKSFLRCKLENTANDKENWSVRLTHSDGESVVIVPTLNNSHEADIVRKWLAERLRVGSVAVRPEDGMA